MLANKTLSIDGKTYDRFTVGMAGNATYSGDGKMRCGVSMSLIPTRITEDGVEQAPAGNAIPVVLGDVDSMGDAADKKAFAAIQTAMTTWLQEKGL